MVGLRKAHQNGYAGLVVRLLHVHHKAAQEAGAHAGFQHGDFVRRAVGGQHDLLAVFKQRVERVEEFFLRGLLIGKKLNVVDQKHVHRAHAVAKLHRLLARDGLDHLVGEVLAGGEQDPAFRVFLHDEVRDGVHQMGFAESHAAVDEQRVVRVGRRFGYRHAGVERHAVAVADDEGFKGIFRVQGRGRHFLLEAGKLVRRDHFQIIRLAERFPDDHRKLGLVTLTDVAHDERVVAIDYDAPVLRRMQLQTLEPRAVSGFVHALAQETERLLP